MRTMHWAGLARAFAAITLAMTIAFGATMRPASADPAASTRNSIFGAVLALAGVATAINVSHKNAVANTVTGYLPDGSTVYQDGHVVNPSGQSYYPGNYGQSVSCYGQQCTIAQNGQSGGPGPQYYGPTGVPSYAR